MSMAWRGLWLPLALRTEQASRTGSTCSRSSQRPRKGQLMAKLLVTGGAGFIGSNFVHHVVAHTDHHVTVLDKLTYAGNLASLAGLPEDRCRVRARRHHRRRTRRRAVRRRRRGGALRRRVAQRQLAARSAAVPGHEHRRHVHAAGGGAPPRHAAAPHLHRRGLRRPRARRPGAVHRDDARTTRRSPYSSTKAGSDLLVRAWVRSFGVRATISNCSNNYGPYQHVEKFIPRQITNVIRGIRPKLYGDGRERARLDPRRRPLLRRADASSRRARSARPT